MAFFDFPLDTLKSYTPERNERADFDAFWLICRCMQRTLPAQHP